MVFLRIVHNSSLENSLTCYLWFLLYWFMLPSCLSFIGPFASALFSRTSLHWLLQSNHMSMSMLSSLCSPFAVSLPMTDWCPLLYLGYWTLAHTITSPYPWLSPASPWSCWVIPILIFHPLTCYISICTADGGVPVGVAWTAVWICRGFGYLGKWQMSVKPASRRVASVVGNWRPMWHRWVQGVWSLEGVAEGFGPGSWQVATMSGILQVQLCPDAKYMLVIGWGNGMSQLCFSTFLPVLVIGPEEWPHQMCLYRMVMFLYLLEVFMFMYCCIIGPELSFYVFICNWLAGVAFPKYFCAFSSEGYKGVGSTLGCADCL